jgi:purine-binding chemotaxis protein CheW
VVVRATPTASQAVEVGLIVDKVSEVLDIADGDVDAAPSFGVDVETDYLLGVGKAAGKVKLLLDIDRVLSTQDVVDIRLAAGAAV